MPENLRDWSEDFDQENGNYDHRCIICGNEFVGSKHRVVCKACDPTHKTADPTLQADITPDPAEGLGLP